MKKKMFAGVLAAAVCVGALPVFAGDADQCLDCHEPAEDWEGLSSEDIMAKAKDPSNRRHADNQDLSDEQLKAIIAELMPQ